VSTLTLASPAAVARAEPGRTARLLRALLGSRTAAFGLALTTLLVLVALLAPWLAPYRQDEIHPLDSLTPPSAAYLLGTDDLGRDILSRIIYGARVSLMVAGIAIGIAALVGVPLGLAAGYAGGALDSLLMRLMDALLAFPAILLAIALMAVLGPSLHNAMIAIGIIYVPAFARITRANVLSLREVEFVEAARALGAGSVYVAALVILPNCLSPIIVQGSLAVANAILVEAALSFLGLGVQPPDPSWGSMLAFGRSLLSQAPWYATFPGIAIFVTVLSLNFLGDGLREALDPRLASAEGGR
jgi:ABC-type dipeptide/oligopeptide/nickel transport system permease subunit